MFCTTSPARAPTTPPTSRLSQPTNTSKMRRLSSLHPTHLVNLLYVILCGLVAASPSCCLCQSTYSEKLREQGPRVVEAMGTARPCRRLRWPEHGSPLHARRPAARAVPSKNVTLESRSNARMWVATRSRHQQSWEMTIARPTPSIRGPLPAYAAACEPQSRPSASVSSPTISSGVARCG